MTNNTVVVVVVYYTHIFTRVLDIYIKNIRYVLETQDYKQYKHSIKEKNHGSHIRSSSNSLENSLNTSGVFQSSATSVGSCKSSLRIREHEYIKWCSSPKT